MAGRTWLLAGGLAALLSAPAGGAGATALVGLTADGLGGTLYDVDETSGAISNPRDVIGGLGGLTYLSTGELVATRHHSSGFGLYEVAQATGDTTLLVNFSNNVVEGGVAEDPDTGILYAVNMDPGPDVNGLFSIDIGAGTTTFIGSIYDTDGSGTGMDLSGLIFDLDGRLWALRDIGAIELVEIDPSDASVVSFLPITGGLPVSSALAGLALHPITGRLYLSYVSQLYDLDQSTGAATAIGGTGGETLAGLAWDPRVVPEPGTAGLLALGIGALAIARRPPSPVRARVSATKSRR